MEKSRSLVERARLEIVYTPKGYRGFESLLLRHNLENPAAGMVAGFFVFVIKVGLGIFDWIEIDSAGHGTIERSHAKGGAICEL